MLIVVDVEFSASGREVAIVVGIERVARWFARGAAIRGGIVFDEADGFFVGLRAIQDAKKHRVRGGYA